MCRVRCGHCREVFLFNTLVNQLARCPHCEKKSSVGDAFAKGRGLVFLVLALIALFVAIIVTVFTSKAVADGAKGWIAAYIIFYFAFLYFSLRSIYFFTMKSSKIIDNQT